MAEGDTYSKSRGDVATESKAANSPSVDLHLLQNGARPFPLIHLSHVSIPVELVRYPLYEFLLPARLGEKVAVLF